MDISWCTNTIVQAVYIETNIERIENNRKNPVNIRINEAV